MENRVEQYYRESPSVQRIKKRVRFTNIPLDVSDFVIEDMIKEFPQPIYSKFYDTKDSRIFIVEFGDPTVMDKVIEKYNATELNGSTITAVSYTHLDVYKRQV